MMTFTPTHIVIRVGLGMTCKLGERVELVRVMKTRTGLAFWRRADGTRDKFPLTWAERITNEIDC